MLAAHIEQMVASGIGTVVASWWGPRWRNQTADTQGVSTDAALDALVAALEAQPALRRAVEEKHVPWHWRSGGRGGKGKGKGKSNANSAAESAVKLAFHLGAPRLH